VAIVIIILLFPCNHIDLTHLHCRRCILHCIRIKSSPTVDSVSQKYANFGWLELQQTSLIIFGRCYVADTISRHSCVSALLKTLPHGNVSAHRTRKTMSCSSWKREFISTCGHRTVQLIIEFGNWCRNVCTRHPSMTSSTWSSDSLKLGQASLLMKPTQTQNGEYGYV